MKALKRELANEVLDPLAMIADNSDFSTDIEELVKVALVNLINRYVVAIVVLLQAQEYHLLCKGKVVKKQMAPEIRHPLS